MVKKKTKNAVTIFREMNKIEEQIIELRVKRRKLGKELLRILSE